MDVTIRGVGGHGARPEATKDPIVMAAEYILALQTIVSRQIPPQDPAVVTVGSIHGGSKHNIIPDEVKLAISPSAPSTRMFAGISWRTSIAPRAASPLPAACRTIARPS